MPIGSLRKFILEKGGPDSPHQGELHWPGTGAGFPVRGPTADLRQSEFEALEHVIDYRSQMFKLWVPDEKKAFDELQDRIANGWFVQRKRYDIWSEVNFGFAVWMEWWQIYGEVPVKGIRADDATPIPFGQSATVGAAG